MESASTSNAIWRWPYDIGSQPSEPHGHKDPPMPGTFQDDDSPSNQRSSGANERPRSTPKPTKHWPPRTCRICLETVLPTYSVPTTNLPDILQPRPSVTYESSDPESGRLIRPCKCKGSSRYVHEGCLQAWRHADPEYGAKNYWKCPTCGFKYRLERMRWGRAISSPLTQIVLTFSTLLFAMFLLGFVADPIINLYLDPYSTLSSAPFGKLSTKIEPIFSDDDEVSWLEHFIKGLASLGLLSFVKVLLALSPWQWWNLRSSGMLGGSGRAGGSGRDRLASISWLVVIIGVGTFLWVSVNTCNRAQSTDCHRESTKVSVSGADEPWRGLVSVSWTFHSLMTTTKI